MNSRIGFDRCLSFINCNMSPSHAPTSLYRNGEDRRAISISRQTGSGAHTIAEKLVTLLQETNPPEARPWTVFDRNLVEQVLADHKLPARLAQFMREDRIPEIADTIDELFGLHPSSWALVHKVAETILHLAELGNVILIGRGAPVITARLPYVFRVRLVGSLETRVRRIEETEHLNSKEAMDLVLRDDRGRKRFLRKYFEKDIDDPLLYHLTMNTDSLSPDEAARMIANGVLKGVPAAHA